MCNIFNSFRATVAQGSTSQPPASNMMELVWDEELATVAQRLADQCVFSHDCSDCRQVERFRVGQNLYQSFNTRPGDLSQEWTNAVDSWYKEISVFPGPVESFTFSQDTGHYTQMMWATTTRLGCGMSEFSRGRFIARLLVCNYGEAGNIISAPLYTVGPACSACPSSSFCSPAYPSLCSQGAAPSFLPTTPFSAPSPQSPPTFTESSRPLALLPLIANNSSQPSPPAPVPAPSPPTSLRPIILLPSSSSDTASCEGSRSFFCLLGRPVTVIMEMGHHVMHMGDMAVTSAAHVGDMTVNNLNNLRNLVFSSFFGK